MPSPSQEMINTMFSLRLEELDEDVHCDLGSNSHILGQQATELLAHEDTSHFERLLLSITIGMVNQNAILTRQLAELNEEQHQMGNKLATIATKVDRAHDRISAIPKPTHPPTAQQPATRPIPPAPPGNPNPNRRENRNPPGFRSTMPDAELQARFPLSPAPPAQPAPKANRAAQQPAVPSYVQVAQDTLNQWQQVNRKRNTPRTTKAPKAKETGPKTLPAVQRRFFATRKSPEAIENPEALGAELSVTFGHFMATQKQVAPVTAVTVTVNQRGAVTVLPAPTVPSSVYAPYFEALTSILNNRINSEANPFHTFKPAPTDVDIAIYGIPLFNLKTKEDLNDKFPDILVLATGVAPIATRFLHVNHEERNSRKTATVVVTVSAAEAALFGSSIPLLSRPRKCAVMWTASPITQCKKCYKFGHPEQGCKQEHHTCPICAQDHSKREHACPVQCDGPRLRPTGCCAAVTPKCINCGGGHASTANNCPVLTALMENSSIKKTSAPPAPASSNPSNPPSKNTVSPEASMPDANSAAPITHLVYLMSITNNDNSFLRIIQHNCNNSNNVFISLFAIPMVQSAHAIAVQEPPLYKSKPLAVPAFTAIYPTPTSPEDKISVCTYINNNFLQRNSFANPPSHRGDIITASLTCHTGPNTNTTITIINCYNRQLRDGTRSIHPLTILPTSDNPSITVGDLNIHNPATDPARNFSARELRLSQPYMDTASRAGYSILNTRGHTPESPSIKHTETEL